MKRTIATIGASLVAAALTATVTAAPATAADDAFYQPPAQLPADNGALVRTEPQELSITILLQTIKGDGTRLMYKSTDAAGNPVAVTGTYIEPEAEWTGNGPRPLVAFGPGTQGQGDLCAPSKSLSRPIDVRPGELAVGYEAPQIAALVDEGFGVVVTDYIGLGNPDRLHTYTVREDLGHALLDAARAAKNLDGTSLASDSPVGLYGYSQGGGATGAAAELAPTYAPELNLKGAYVGAPPADLFEVLKTVDGMLLVSSATPSTACSSTPPSSGRSSTPRRTRPARPPWRRCRSSASATRSSPTRSRGPASGPRPVTRRPTSSPPTPRPAQSWTSRSSDASARRSPSWC